MADSATRDKEMDESINLLRQNPQKYKEAFNSVYGEGSAESVFKAYGISETPQAATPVSTEPVEPVEPEDDGGPTFIKPKARESEIYATEEELAGL